MSTFVTERRADTGRWLLLLRLCGAACAVGLVIWFLGQGIELDPIEIRGWFVDLGPIAPLAYVLVYALQVIVAPIPGVPIGAAAGFVFGLVPAILYGMIGLAIGVTVALAIGRVWGLRLLARVAGPDVIARWEQFRLINSPLTWLAIFLGPSPDIVIFVAGMTRVPFWQLVLVGLLGRAPAMLGATLIGAGVLDMGPWVIVGVTVLGVLACGGGFLFRRALPGTA